VGHLRLRARSGTWSQLVAVALRESLADPVGVGGGEVGEEVVAKLADAAPIVEQRSRTAGEQLAEAVCEGDPRGALEGRRHGESVGLAGGVLTAGAG
jgi:hypothetical protein